MLTIGELATRFGLATHVLRHWEDEGLLSPARRAGAAPDFTECSHFHRLVAELGSRTG